MASNPITILNCNPHLRIYTLMNMYQNRLLQLPLPILHRICTYALTVPGEIILNPLWATFSEHRQTVFALIRTCRQLYVFTRYLFHAVNTFNLPYYRFFLDTWKGGAAGRSRIFSAQQRIAVRSIVLEESNLFFFNGMRWVVPWVAYIRTFPNLKKVVLRGEDLRAQLEQAAIDEGSASWMEYVGTIGNGKLDVIIESH